MYIGKYLNNIYENWLMRITNYVELKENILINITLPGIMEVNNNLAIFNGTRCRLLHFFIMRKILDHSSELRIF